MWLVVRQRAASQKEKWQAYVIQILDDCFSQAQFAFSVCLLVSPYSLSIGFLGATSLSTGYARQLEATVQNVHQRTQSYRAGAQGIGFPRCRPLENSTQDPDCTAPLQMILLIAVLMEILRLFIRILKSVAFATFTCAKSSSLRIPLTRS